MPSDGARRRRPLGRARTFALVTTLIGLAFLLGLVFVPSTYIVRSRFRLPHDYWGFRAVRYGVSRVGGLTFVDYVDGSGANVHDARSFVDYVDGAATRREYGWRLKIHPTPDRSLVRLDLR